MNTLRQVLRDYQNEHCKRKGVVLKRVAIAEAHLVSFFGVDYGADKFDHAEALRYEDHRLSKGVSGPTVRRELGVLRAAYVHAAKRRRVSAVPFFDMPEDSRPREQWLTQEQAEDLLAEDMHPRTRLYVLIACGSGARKEAIEDLVVRRVSFEDGTIDFRDPDKRVTKKRRAKIAMADFLRPFLEAACAGKKPDDKVLPDGPDVYHEIKRLLAKKGITGVAPCHIFKHSFTTWALRSGESIWKVSATVATSIPTLTKNYAHSLPSDSRSIVNSFQQQGA